MELGTGIAIAGLAFAVAFGLPSIFSFLRAKSDQSLTGRNRDAIADLAAKVNRLEASSELGRECLETLTTTLIIHRAIVREFEGLDNEKQRIADDIFYEQRNRLRKKLLHLELVQIDSSEVVKAAFQIASQAGDVDSIRWLQNAGHFIDEEFSQELDRLTKMLEDRLRVRNNLPSRS